MTKCFLRRRLPSSYPTPRFSPGITPKILAKELKELEQHELIKRVIIEDYPIKITYRLEEYADTLTPIIYALKDWGLNHRRRIFSKG